MINQTFPIIPPPELVGQWLTEAADLQLLTPSNLDYLATQAAQWGADKQLEECVAWLDGYEREGWAAEQMRNDCRPKPPSLRKQAYDALDTYIYGEPDPKDKERTYNTIRQALEALPND